MRKKITLIMCRTFHEWTSMQSHNLKKELRVNIKICSNEWLNRYNVPIRNNENETQTIETFKIESNIFKNLNWLKICTVNISNTKKLRRKYRVKNTSLLINSGEHLHTETLRGNNEKKNYRAVICRRSNLSWNEPLIICSAAVWRNF